ncbi:MAG: hypothetical protein ABIZ04_10690 [Opitutus sp.]
MTHDRLLPMATPNVVGHSEAKAAIERHCHYPDNGDGLGRPSGSSGGTTGSDPAENAQRAGAGGGTTASTSGIDSQSPGSPKPP